MLKKRVSTITTKITKGITTTTVAIALVGGLSFSYFANQSTHAQTTTLKQSKTIQDFAPRLGFADLIEQVSPAVVHVSISGTPKANQLGQEFNFPPGSPFEEFFKRYGQPETEKKQRKRKLGIGSGFLVSADGYLITNNHVVDGGDEIQITLADGTEYEGTLIGADKKTDLAVVKIETKFDLPFVNWGDDQRSRIGDWVLAIGHPFGLDGGASASTGIISARGRDIRSGPYDNYLQVDAAINRGNSGGPLFNLDGQVIGINTAIYSPNGGSVGIGFAIPSTLAKRVTNQLISSGSVERGLIGVQIQPLTDDLIKGFDRDNKDGALVASVVPGKPAEAAGIKAGDIILKFDGKPIKEMRDLPRIVADTKVGSKVRIHVWRDGKMIKKKIKVARFEDDALAVTEEPEQTGEEDEFGADLVELDDKVRNSYNIDKDVTGVLIEQTKQDGLARANGLRAGDIIQKVGKKTIRKVSDLRSQMARAKKQKLETIVMLIYRENTVRFIPFRFE
ncbi:MAG: Do family serine endopeptidase [Arenicella sp.]